MNGRTNSSGSSVNDLQIPLDPCTNLECVAGNAQVELTWTDPLNKYATPEGEVAEDPDQLVSVWHHTVVIRKVGSAPVGIDDGIVVVSSEVKNQYQSTAYIDTGLVNDTTYYYGVFAVNEDGVESEGLVSEGVTPKLGTPLSELAEGTIIKINENGAPVEFYLAKHNYEPDLNGPGRELLVRKDIYSNIRWNQDKSGSSSNAFDGSTIDNISNNEYISIFSNYVKTAMMETYFRTIKGHLSWGDVVYSRKIFILSIYELGIRPSMHYAHDDSSKLNISNLILISNYNNTSSEYWTRSPQTSGFGPVFYITAEGGYMYKLSDVLCGFRPCFTLPSTVTINETFEIIEY